MFPPECMFSCCCFRTGLLTLALELFFAFVLCVMWRQNVNMRFALRPYSFSTDRTGQRKWFPRGWGVLNVFPAGQRNAQRNFESKLTPALCWQMVTNDIHACVRFCLIYMQFYNVLFKSQYSKFLSTKHGRDSDPWTVFLVTGKHTRRSILKLDTWLPSPSHTWKGKPLVPGKPTCFVARTDLND